MDEAQPDSETWIDGWSPDDPDRFRRMNDRHPHENPSDANAYGPSAVGERFSLRMMTSLEFGQLTVDGNEPSDAAGVLEGDLLEGYVGHTDTGLLVRAGVVGTDIDLMVEASVRPSALDEEWEWVAEGSVRTDLGYVIVNGTSGRELLACNAAILGAGDYRVRACASGRHSEMEDEFDGRVERYLIQIWPDSPRGLEVMRRPDTTPDPQT